ncbi:hypothetical protein N4R43_03275 [Lactococcus lactis]|uniref:hypothetical protein n=1 Tax=Lactococcus lactis TaxID=1358 RepID=UPI002938E5BC|nr:hypothetical protein [Lactococcus lactis]WOF40955.1 hypothetical protein N4R43_03275 [Lactococcus lactis]
MKSRKKVISIILGLMLLLQYVITPVGAIAGAINEETNHKLLILESSSIKDFQLHLKSQNYLRQEKNEILSCL